MSYFISKTIKKPIIFGYPIAASFEPTTACNLSCPECPSGLKQFTRPEGNAKSNIYHQFIKQNYKTLYFVNFYFQGEPFIHPDILDMISYANKHKIITSTSTNGHFITENKAKEIVKSGLKKIIISIDGTTQETYEKYRVNGSLKKAIEGVKNIINAKKKLKSQYPKVFIQFLVVKPNQHQIKDIKKLGSRLNVDKVTLKTAQIYDFENGNELIPTIDKYSRYKKLKSGKYAIKNPLKNECWRMWSSFVSTWDGKIIPCCFDKDATKEMGNLKTSNFKSIWKSKPYQNFRKQILINRNKIDICNNCTEGSKTFI